MPNEPLRLLAVGAHPDDIEFGCGGILLNEAARGSEIALCVCSRGEAGTNGSPDEREKEARRAAELLGATVAFLDLGGDCHMEISTANSFALAREIRRTRADIALAPTLSPHQHSDHIVVGQLCRNAARFARYGGLAELREVAPHAIKQQLECTITPGAEPPDDSAKIRCDISEYYEAWIALMECHQTQLRTRHYVELQAARARRLGIEAGVEHAQALFPTADFLIGSLSELPASARLF